MLREDTRKSTVRLTQSIAALLMLITAIITTGCRSGFFGPRGPINVQQRRAIVHDPYPAVEIGREDVTARPRDFQRSLAEPVRNRMWDEQKHLFEQR